MPRSQACAALSTDLMVAAPERAGRRTDRATSVPRVDCDRRCSTAVSAARESWIWIWIWPVFRDGNCPLRRVAPVVCKELVRSVIGVLPEGTKGLLVDRRLSTPAVLPGVRRVIVTGQRVLVMPA